MTQTTEPFRVNEGSSARLAFTLLDQAGVGVGSGSLTSLTLTLFDVGSNVIINGRDEQDVLNANDVIVDASGAVVWSLEAADNPIIGQPGLDGVEEHRAMFLFTWATGQGTREFRIQVANLQAIT